MGHTEPFPGLPPSDGPATSYGLVSLACVTETADTRVVSPEHDLRGVLRIPAFRKLWTALSLSSFGDWLGLLALTALAPKLASDGYAAANIAISGVFILRLAPAILIGPFAGVVADRLDRRWTMVICDLARFALFVSIPVVGTLWWLLVATFLIETASLVWIPAKEATVPNLVPRERLETANQLSLFTTYGSAPVAAAVFSGLALLTGVLDNAVPGVDRVYLALFFNAATFLVSALTILSLREIPPRAGSTEPAHKPPGVWSTLVEGWRFVGTTKVVRGLIAGMLGAFAAGGAVIGLARTFVLDLGGGEPGYGLLFGTVFLGLAAGMFLGPRMVPDFSRRRLIGLSITSAGLSLSLLALIPNMVAAVIITFVIGAWAGVAWVTGYTLLGLEVADELRGRTFAFVQTMVRLVLVLVLVVSPLMAAAFGPHQIEVTDAMVLTYNGAAITMLLFGLLAAALGVASYRQMDDRSGVPLIADLVAAYRREPVGLPRGQTRSSGFFLAIEGGEGAGKSTQAGVLAQWLRGKGHEVVVTFEPGATPLGSRLRSLLLDGLDGPGGERGLSARAEALLFAADRAEHMARVIEPALERGDVVITDRFTDSSIAYQGAGRALEAADIARLSRWATQERRPDLTVLLDVSPDQGRSRAGATDRIESEPETFHQRVRERFLELAERGGSRYLVIDATDSPDEVAEQIQARLGPSLPMSAREAAERETLLREEEARAAEQAEVLAAEAAVAAEARAREEQVAAVERERVAALAAEQRIRQEEERQRAEEARVSAERDQRRLAAEEKARRRAMAAQEKARRKTQERQQPSAVSVDPTAVTARFAPVDPTTPVSTTSAAQTTDSARTRDKTVARTSAARESAPGGPPAPDPAHQEAPTRELSLLDEILGADQEQTALLPAQGEDDARGPGGEGTASAEAALDDDIGDDPWGRDARPRSRGDQ